jgi:hypothetical protein
MTSGARHAWLTVLLAVLGPLALVEGAACAGGPSPSPPVPMARSATVPSVSVPVGSATAAEVASCRPLPVLAAVPPIGSSGGLRTDRQPSLPSTAPAAMLATCRKLQRARDVNVRGAPGYGNPSWWNESTYGTVGHCYGTAHGAWVIEVSPFVPAKVDGVLFRRARWGLLHVTPEGRTLRGETARWESLESLAEMHGEVAMLAVGDVDGDGIPDALVEHSESSALDGTHHEVLAFTRRGDVVSEWGAERSLRAWVDVDADGRLDLLGPSTHALDEMPALAHALPDASFSEDDLVVQGAMQQVCPAPPSGPVVDHRGVVCARLWGASRAEVEHRITEAGMIPACAGPLLRETIEWQAPPLLSGACAVGSAPRPPEVPASCRFPAGPAPSGPMR